MHPQPQRFHQAKPSPIQHARHQGSRGRVRARTTPSRSRSRSSSSRYRNSSAVHLSAAHLPRMALAMKTQKPSQPLLIRLHRPDGRSDGRSGMGDRVRIQVGPGAAISGHSPQDSQPPRGVGVVISNLAFQAGAFDMASAEKFCKLLLVAADGPRPRFPALAGPAAPRRPEDQLAAAAAPRPDATLRL